MKKTAFICAALFMPAVFSAFAEETPKTLRPLIKDLHICGAISFDKSDHAYISEWSSERVGIYDKNGNLIRTIEEIGDPSGNTFDDDGNFYVSSYSYGTIWKITPSGEKSIYASGFNVPAGLSWIEGSLYAANRDAGELVSIDKNGRKKVLAENLPQPVSCLKMKDGSIVISCLNGSPHILAPDETVSVLIPQISSSGINIIPDGQNSFLFCVISDGTVERVTVSKNSESYTAARKILASGFSVPIGIARRSDGKILFDAWGQSAAYLMTVK
ncbi:MAG: hypothetical protein NC041_09190 [Bacteroides sp.]|nr:hypothetical protein [Prevotella sp.]MCM1408710.1 hypothetical protein [Treponema brennaborense]MCM1470625.1 hypothetical protein [Bacteroides sp.]